MKLVKYIYFITGAHYPLHLRNNLSYHKVMIAFCISSYHWWWCTMWTTHAQSLSSLGPFKWSLQYVTIALFGNHYIIQHLCWLVFATLRHLKYVIRGAYCIMPTGQYTRFANRFCQFEQVLRCKVKHCSK